MCTMIVEKAQVEGSAKGPQGWFQLSGANVSYDHPFHSPADHTLNIDFVNDAQGLGARVAVELSAESALKLVDSIMAALDTAQAQHEIAALQSR